MYDKKRTRRQEANRKEAKEQIEFIDSYGGSTADKARATIQAGKGERKTANQRLIQVMGPQPDVRTGRAGDSYRTAHTGRNGAPSIYREEPGGRAGGRGRRVTKPK